MEILNQLEIKITGQEAMGYRLVFLNFIFLLVTNFVLAQTKVSPLDLIEGISDSTNLNFYFDESQLASLPATTFYNHLVLLPALSDYLNQYGLKTIKRGKTIFIIDGSNIAYKFPRNFSNDDSALSFDSDQTYQTTAYDDQIINPEFELIKLGSPSGEYSNQVYQVNGHISTFNDEPVVGATIFLSNGKIGAVADLNGYYEIEIPAGSNKLIYQAVGMRPTSRTLQVYASGVVDISMADEITELVEVVVLGDQQNNVQNMSIGVERIKADELNRIPMALGEPDVMRAMLTLPGVQTVTEVSNGFNVRGGGVDQNLVLLDNAPIINSSHFFGFFSAFNSDVVADATLYKGAVPASHGGRLSSVLDVQSRNGSMEKFGGSVGIGPVTGRLNVEGPIIKNRISFLLAARSTYSDWLLNSVKDVRIKNSKASFYDGMTKFNYRINDKSGMELTLYRSSDKFLFDGISSYEYANNAGSLEYYLALKGLFFESTLNVSKYDFQVINISNPAAASDFIFGLNQIGSRQNFTYKKGKMIDMEFGMQNILYKISPGQINPFGPGSFIISNQLEQEQGLENALYIQNQHQFDDKLTLSIGMRYSAYLGLGPETRRTYFENAAPSDQTVVDTSYYVSGSITSFFSGFEPRLMLKYNLGHLSSLKLSYNRMRQYLNLLSNNITPAPTDIWKLSSRFFPPQVADQFTIGYYRNFVNVKGTIADFSVEGYYKSTDRLVDYKTGASIIANDFLETEVLKGNSESYGLEVQFGKHFGQLTGWTSYTYSRVLNRFRNQQNLDLQINNGKKFPANIDKPHAFKAVVNYDFYRRLRASANINYSTGRPVTLPVSAYQLGGLTRVQYESRNQSRLPDYFRLDLSATWEGNIKKDKLIYDSYTISVVNVTGRYNPYSVFFQYDGQDRLRGYSLAIFARPLISISANFKF